MKLTARQGRLSISLRVFRQGRDLQVLCGGGASHIGAVALAAPVQVYDQQQGQPGLAAHGITLHYTQPALADIVAESSTKYGARELRRTIRKTIEDPVSDALVDGRLDGREVTLELADHDGRAVLEI